MNAETFVRLKPYVEYREPDKDHDADLAFKRRRAVKWLEAERARKAAESGSKVVDIKARV